MMKYWNYVFITLSILIGLGCMGVTTTEKSKTANQEVKEEVEDKRWWQPKPKVVVKPGVTRANYNRIAEGMHYEDVCAILGDRGKETSRSGNLVSGVWENKTRGEHCIISILFENGHMKSKAISSN